MFKKNNIVFFILILPFFSFTHLTLAVLEQYHLDREKKEIDEHETDYEVSVYDFDKSIEESDEEETEKPIANASYTVYENLYMKTTTETNEIQELLKNEAEMNSMYAKFPQKFFSTRTLILLTNFFVEPKYRRDGLGSELFQNGVNFFKKQHPGSIIVWIARPFGEKKTTLEKLIDFYDKNNGKMFFKDNNTAYYYLPLPETYIMRYEKKMMNKLGIFYHKSKNQDECYRTLRKKRTYNELENATTENSFVNKKRRIFKLPQNYYPVTDQKKPGLISIIRAYKSMPYEFSLF